MLPIVRDVCTDTQKAVNCGARTVLPLPSLNTEKTRRFRGHEEGEGGEWLDPRIAPNGNPAFSPP